MEFLGHNETPSQRTKERIKSKPDVVALAYISSTQKTEAGGWFETNLSYIMRVPPSLFLKEPQGKFLFASLLSGSHLLVC